MPNEEDDSKLPPPHPKPAEPRRRQRRSANNVHAIQSFLRSLVFIDHTAISFVPPMRTAAIMMIEMFLIGIKNNKSTAFRLGALYVGFSDPSSSLSRRLRYMGLTSTCVIVFGALLPALTWMWDSPAATLVTSFLVALLTGLSPLVGSPGLFQAMKLGLALFAVNGGVNKSTEGYGGLGFSVYWIFWGAFSSLALALIPEIIGNRDAARTDLFKSLRGFGMDLSRWGKDWGTARHFNIQPIPTVTLSISATKSRISRDDVETEVAKEWLLSVLGSADVIRIAGLCLTNSLVPLAGDDVGKEETDAFFRAVGQATTRLSFALQFPWMVRYLPFLRDRVVRGVHIVNEASADLLNVGCNEENGNSWLASIVELMQSEIQNVSELVCNGKTWPPYSSLSSLPRRILASFPHSLTLNADPEWAIRGYAIRLSIAFTLAMVPELIITTGGKGAHWFPMTVALIMVPKKAATHEKVVHRVIGTLLGLGLGALMVPLFDFRPVLIILLGLTTYAAVLFVAANYALFTFFVTGWVYVTVIGAGGSALASTTLYRCGWTLAAGALVMIIMLTQRPKTNDDVGSVLAEFAGQTLQFARALLEQCRLRRLGPEEEGNKTEDAFAAVEAAKATTDRIRGTIVLARTKMLARINEAALSPSEGYSIDPHSLAPWLARDLTNAVAILQTVYLISDESADDLLSDVDPAALSELERLVRRLESQEHVPSLSSDPDLVAVAMLPEGRGPFSNAIGSAHSRLNEAGVCNKYVM